MHELHLHPERQKAAWRGGLLRPQEHCSQGTRIHGHLSALHFMLDPWSQFVKLQPCLGDGAGAGYAGRAVEQEILGQRVECGPVPGVDAGNRKGNKGIKNSYNWTANCGAHQGQQASSWLLCPAGSAHSSVHALQVGHVPFAILNYLVNKFQRSVYINLFSYSSYLSIRS